MSCDNLVIPKPLTNQCPTTLFGIPYGAAGRTVAGQTFPISGIVLHCHDGTVAELCNEMKCRTRSSVITGTTHNSYHYSIGAAASSGGFQQHVEDGNISWTWGTYKNNSYASVPPPNVAINWPVLQAEHGLNTTPDVYTIDIALAMGAITPASSPSNCYECPTASGLQPTQHDMLVQMLAFLAKEHGIPIDQDHIQFHDHIACEELDECPCTDIATLLEEVEAYCPPCDQEALSAPEAQVDDNITHIYGITEPCCPDSAGCLVHVPWNGCFIGDLAVDGTLDSYILGLTQDPVTGQWCLTRGCLATISPLIGCGTTEDPLRLDICAFGAWIPDEPAINIINLVGIDAEGCLIESPVCDVVTACIDCDFYAGLFVGGTLESITGFDDAGVCVTETVADMIGRSITVADTDCIDLEFVGNELTATLIVDPDPDNIIECRATGLYAPIIEVLDTNCIDLDLTAGVLSAQPIISPDAGNQLICQANGLFVPPITVTDDDCIDLTLVGNDLTASLIIAPAQAGVTNVFECIAGQGVFVPRGADANVNGPITGNGSDTNPLDIDFTALDAQDLCDLGGVIPAGTIVDLVGTDGLDCLITEPLDTVIDRVLNVDNTDCIALDLTATVLTATPIISPPIGGINNALSCTPTGLYVPRGANLLVQDTNCINLTLVDGLLTADIDIDPTGDNQFTCTPNGAYVPLGAGLSVAPTDCIDLNLIGGEITAYPIIAAAQGGIPNSLQCITGEGLYVAETANLLVFDTACINLTLNNDNELVADLILDPNVDNQASCGAAGLFVPPAAGLQVFNTDCIALALTNGDELRATPIIAPAQGPVSNALQCLPGQGLFVAGVDVSGVDVFQITDDQANTQQIVGGDTIIFEGINGATQRVSAVDTVTIDGHEVFSGVAPGAPPPYDTDQIWHHYNTNTGVTYTWNPDTNKWETCAHVTNAATPPDGTTCQNNQIISGVIDGVWCPGTSTYTIPAGGGVALDRTWLLTSDCEWCYQCGLGGSTIRKTTNPQTTLPLDVPTEINFDIIDFDEWGAMSTITNSFVVPMDGCYHIDGNAILSYDDVNFDAGLIRLILVVDGTPTLNLDDYAIADVDRPFPAPQSDITLPLVGSIYRCFQEGTILTLSTSFTNNLGVGTYDLTLGSFTIRGPV